jgi:hypothetical protein
MGKYQCHRPTQVVGAHQWQLPDGRVLRVVGRTMILLAFFLILMQAAPVAPAEVERPPALLNVTARNGELFEAPGGVNEFDIEYVDGAYHWVYARTDSRSYYRTAATLAGLADAEDYALPVGGVPTLYYEGGTWHLWLGYAYNHPKHYTTSDPAGTWTFVDHAMPAHAGDPEMMGKIGNMYYGSYGGQGTWISGILTTHNPYGPWTDTPDVFSEVGRAPWHINGEADTSLVFRDGRLFMFFSGRRTVDHRQVLGVVELDPDTRKAVAAAQIIHKPMEAWENDLGIEVPLPVVMSPRYLEVAGQPRIYYSHFNQYSGTDDSWGYLEIKWLP